MPFHSFQVTRFTFQACRFTHFKNVPRETFTHIVSHIGAIVKHCVNHIEMCERGIKTFYINIVALI